MRVRRKLKTLTPKNVIGVLLITHIFMLSYLRTTIYFPTLDSISESEVNSYDWINQNIPPAKNFVILTQSPNWYMDNYVEWFPALTQQKNFTTVQGTESFQGSKYSQAIWYYNGFKSLYESINCISNTTGYLNLNVDYIVINHDNCEAEKILCLIHYSEVLNSSNKFTLIYESSEVSIFQVNS